MFTTREKTIFWVRAQQQVKVKEEMCFILWAFHGLTQKLHGLQWFNFMMSYTSSPTLSSYCDWRYSNALLFCREKWGYYTAKKALLLRKKRQRNSEKSVISVGTNWFLASQNEMKTEYSTEEKYGQGAPAVMVTPTLTSWPLTCVFTDLVSFFSTHGPLITE